MSKSNVMIGFASAVLVGLRVLSPNIDDAIDHQKHIDYKRGGGVTVPVDDSGGDTSVNFAEDAIDRRKKGLSDPFLEGHDLG